MWVLPALKQIMEICRLFNEAPASYGQPTNRSSHLWFRNKVIGDLQDNHKIVVTVSQNLFQYMLKAAEFHKGL